MVRFMGGRSDINAPPQLARIPYSLLGFVGVGLAYNYLTGKDVTNNTALSVTAANNAHGGSLPEGRAGAEFYTDVPPTNGHPTMPR
jgi:hypothetical protein